MRALEFPWEITETGSASFGAGEEITPSNESVQRRPG